MKTLQHLVNADLAKSVENYDKLSTFVYELMHLDKTKHKVWVVTKQHQLTIMTDNPYLATQLRYQQNAICTALNQQFLLELKTVQVKIIPPSVSIEQKKAPIFRVSEKASEVLSTIANDIEDEGLKESLLKIAQRGQDKGNN